METKRQKKDNVTVSLDPSASEKVEGPVQKVWRVYEKLLEQRGAVDFELLLFRTIRLLEDNAPVSGIKIRFINTQNFKIRFGDCS